MAFESLKKDLIDLDSDMRSYIEKNEAYYKLKVFKILTRSVTMVTQSLFVAAIAFLALFIISIGVSIAISAAMNNLYSGFLIVGVFYILVAVGVYIFRNELHRPLIKKLSKYYFNNDDKTI
jgi:hypothetical protein